jgi:hypothetical protein
MFSPTKIGNRLRTQDERMTADAIFLVQGAKGRTESTNAQRLMSEKRDARRYRPEERLGELGQA